MGQFSVEGSIQDKTLTLVLNGQVDEDTSFAGVSFDGADEIVLDLEKVSAINSCGIREWIKWIKEAPDGVKLIYRNCPKVIVDQINMVSGFLPENGSVNSFYVPYYCDSSGSEKMILFTKGKEFDGPDISEPEGVKCDESGDEMEMDVIEAKYFKFLTKQK